MNRQEGTPVMHVTKSLLVGAAVLGAISVGGCATKEYVDKQVLGVHSEAQATQTSLDEAKTDLASANSKNSAQDQQLAQLDTTTREALQRATAAGKLAEGKFLYSMVLSDDSVKFPVDSAKLSKEAEERLNSFVEKLKSDNRNVYLEIQGHTDARGAATTNQRLGAERAEAVRVFMSKH